MCQRVVSLFGSIRQVWSLFPLSQSFCVPHIENVRVGVTTDQTSRPQISQARVNAAEEGMEAQVVIVVSHGITSRWGGEPVM